MLDPSISSCGVSAVAGVGGAVSVAGAEGCVYGVMFDDDGNPAASPVVDM